MRRFVVPLLACVVLLAGFAPAAEAAPAAAPRVGYVALGDSYAAGVGAPPDGTSGDCERSDRSYPALWAAAQDPATFVSVACSGATTGKVLLTQVHAVSRDTGLVTVTAGGNDAGFSTVLGVCTVAIHDEDCTRAIGAGEKVAKYLVPIGLTAIIGAVKLRSPDARIVVLGYPHLFTDSPDCDVPSVPSAVRRAALNRAADTLDTSLRNTATTWGATYADVTGPFAGHELCGPDPWINPPSDPPRTGEYHPTSRGYARGYLPALTAATTSP